MEWAHLDPELDRCLVVLNAARQQRLCIVRRLHARGLEPHILIVGAQVAALHDELASLRHGPACIATVSGPGGELSLYTGLCSDILVVGAQVANFHDEILWCGPTWTATKNQIHTNMRSGIIQAFAQIAEGMSMAHSLSQICRERQLWPAPLDATTWRCTPESCCVQPQI